MRPQYLLLLDEGGGPEPEALAARTGLEVEVVTPGLALLASEGLSWIALRGDGLVIGPLFHRRGPARPLDSLTATQADAILAGHGATLLDSCWGRYVAAIRQGQGFSLLREPSGAMPCWLARGAGWSACASDAGLLVDAGLVRIDFDWDAVARQLYREGLPEPGTALCGIDELMPGFMTTGAGPQLPCWSPWDHVAASDEAPARLAARLRCVLGHHIPAAVGEGPVLATVSGGLDSSIVAACLAAAGAELTCLTLYDGDPHGDEREHARRLCEAKGLELIERRYRIEDVDLGRPVAPHLPRPIGSAQSLAFEKVNLEVARETGARAFVTGNGGDCVFGYSQSAGAVADRWLNDGVGLRLLRTLADVSRQTGCGLVEAGREGFRIARGPRAYRCRPDASLVHPDRLGGLASQPLAHPWLEAPPDALPGKAAHVATILRIQQTLEPGRSRFLPVLNPLMSQPILEACLPIPTWLWRSGGRDRALVRQAFADDLPASILRRRVKGGPEGFAAELFDRRRDELRDRLLGGHLARERVVDLESTEAALGQAGPVGGEIRGRILQLAVAEAWADHWLGQAKASLALTSRRLGGA